MLRLIECPAETCEHLSHDPCACNGSGLKVAICLYCSADLHEGEGPEDDFCCAACAVLATSERRAVADVRIRYDLFPPLPRDRGAAAIEAFLRVSEVREAVRRWERSA